MLDETFLRYATNPMPVKPISSIAHVEGSGTVATLSRVSRPSIPTHRLGDLRPTARGLLEGCRHEGCSGRGHGAFRDDFVNCEKTAEPVRFEELSASVGAPRRVHLFRRAKDHG